MFYVVIFNSLIIIMIFDNVFMCGRTLHINRHSFQLGGTKNLEHCGIFCSP